MTRHRAAWGKGRVTTGFPVSSMEGSGRAIELSASLVVGQSWANISSMPRLSAQPPAGSFSMWTHAETNRPHVTWVARCSIVWRHVMCPSLWHFRPESYAFLSASLPM